MRTMIALLAALTLCSPVRAQDSTTATVRWGPVQRAQSITVRWTGPFGTAPVLELDPSAGEASLTVPVLDTAYVLTAEIVATNRRGESSTTVERRVPPGLQPPGPIVAELVVDTSYVSGDEPTPEPEPTPPPDPLWPNEPAGMQVVVDEDFNTQQLADAPLGTWGHTPDWIANTEVVSEPSAPHSPPSVLRYTFPAGTQGGTAAGRAAIHRGAGLRFATYYVGYVARWINWVPHVVLDKHMLIGEAHSLDEGHCSCSYIIGSRPDGGVGIFTQFGLRNDARGGIFKNIPEHWGPRIALTPVNDGEWHRIEALFEARQGEDAGGLGRARVWVDGVLQFDIPDVPWVYSDMAALFSGVNIDPIWGGVGGVMEAAQHIEWDHLRVSGL